MRLVCCDCSREAPPGALGPCPDCGGILRPEYPDEALRQLADIPPGPGIDRYRAVLPVSTAIPFLGEGDTPLIRSRRVGPALGLEALYFKTRAAIRPVRSRIARRPWSQPWRWRRAQKEW